MRVCVFAGLVAPVLAGVLFAQTPCPPTPVYQPCDVTYEMTATDAASHPAPYRDVEISGEFRGPSGRTLAVPGFWDGGRKLVVRFAPTEPGQWAFHIVSNLASLPSATGTLQAQESPTDGFLRPRNVHHWAFVEHDKPHLWMGDTCLRCFLLERPQFDAVVEKRSAQKFTHIRVLVTGIRADAPKTFPAPDAPNLEYFREVDNRVKAMNQKGIVADLVLGGADNALEEMFPSREQRENYIRFVVGHFAAMNVTWELVEGFEQYTDGRALLAEMGNLVKKLDPYNHPRSTFTAATSAPLLGDGWMTHVLDRSSDNQLGAIEHQLYPVPFVNAAFGYEDSGAGKTSPLAVGSDEFRHRLWEATMNGQSPVFGNTGTLAAAGAPFDSKYLDSPGAGYMTAWNTFFSQTRYWELEPFFDVYGGRGLSLPGIEYIVYVPGGETVEMMVIKHKYDVRWFNPIDGQFTVMKDNFNAERFEMAPPTKDHDWVLHLSREGTKRGMEKSVIFDSRPILMQEAETSPQRTPFEVVAPPGDEIPVGQAEPYEVKITKQTPGTKEMMFLWTGEVNIAKQGFRVLGTGPKGEFRVPASIIRSYPAVLSVRVSGMNKFGKVYQLDKIYRVTQ